jgi:phosphatidylserine synthase
VQTLHVVARWVSIIGHPFAVTVIMVLGMALRLGSSTPQALRTVLTVVGITVLPIALLMIRKVRKGTWENVDASNRRERPVLFAVGLAGLAVFAGMSWMSGSNSLVMRTCLGVLIMLAACAIATRWIKVSLHMAFCALAATTLLLLHSPLGWIPLVLLPILLWSRLALNRHSLSEVLVGLVTGLTAGLAIAGM